MSTKSPAPRTALAPHVAAEGHPQHVVTFEQMERMASSIAKSGLFGMKSPDQALALMLIAQAEGKNPALIARDFDIIQGRSSKKSEAMLRDFHAAGGRVEWHELTDKKASATFSHPQSGSTVTIDWTIEMAQKAGLAGKDVWKSYPRAMLRSRCVSEGVRTAFPGATSGMYTPEEAADIPELRDVTPQGVESAVAQATENHSATALTEEEREEHLKAIREADDMASLAAVFASAWKHASEAKDGVARNVFKGAYDSRKDALAKSQEPQS